MKQSVDISEHHSIALSVLKIQSIAGWNLLNSKVVESPLNPCNPLQISRWDW